MSRLIQLCAGGCAIVIAGVLGVALLPQPQVAASFGKQAVAKPVIVPPPPVVATAQSAPASDAALVKLAEALKVTPLAVAPATRALAFAGSDAPARGSRPVSPPPAPAPISDKARQLSASGLTVLASGDIAGARALLLRAADEGDARALMALGETYEPATLAGLGVLGIKGDPARARDYYNKALAAGVGAARERLAALN